MAKARTTLTMSIKVKLPPTINAAEMMGYVRSMLQQTPPTTMAPVTQEKIAAAIASDETVVKLVQKVTEYK